jgi:hypothetical protein
MKLFKITSPIIYGTDDIRYKEQYLNIEHISTIERYKNEKLPDMEWTVIFLCNNTKEVDTRSIEKLVKDIERL